MFSSKGKKYIDFTMGWCVGNLGWTVPEIERKLKKFNGPNYVHPWFLYRRWADLAQLLAQITPGKLQHCFRTTGGTESVEFALEAAMAHTERDKFISLKDAYHGDSIGARDVGSPQMGGWFHHRLLTSHRLEGPFDIRALRQVERWLKRRDIAGVILEPIVCNLNVQIPEIEFMQGLQAACRKYGTLLIADEVACGFGRTGKLFASEHYGLEPDILCLAKSLTSGFEAMGTAIVTDEVAQSISEMPTHSTFGWHPRAVEAAIATIQFYQRNWKRMEKHIYQMSGYFEERLSRMLFRYPGKLSVIGLAIGVRFREKGYGEQLGERCRRAGLLISGNEDGFTLFPSLRITREVAKRGLDILEKCAV